MQNIANIKARLSAAKVASRTPSTSPAPTLDLSLANTGDVQGGLTYLGRIVSARFISPQDKTAKIDLCIELLDSDGKRIGVLNDYLFTSARALRRLLEFLLAVGLVTEETFETFHPTYPELCASLPQRLVGLITRESEGLLHEDGTSVIEVAQYITAEEAVTQIADENGEGQD